MTVAELIADLQEQPPDAVVILHLGYNAGFRSIEKVVDGAMSPDDDRDFMGAAINPTHVLLVADDTRIPAAQYPADYLERIARGAAPDLRQSVSPTEGTITQ